MKAISRNSLVPQILTAFGLVLASAAQILGASNAKPPDETNAAQILIKSKFIALPKGAFQIQNLDSLTAARIDSKALTLTEPQTKVLLKALEQNELAETISSPVIMSLSGRQAQVRIGQTSTIITGIKPEALFPPGLCSPSNTTADLGSIIAGISGVESKATSPPRLDAPGLATAELYSITNREFGLTIDVTATVADEGRTILLAITNATTSFLGHQRAADSQIAYVNGNGILATQFLPQIWESETHARATLEDGQSLVTTATRNRLGAKKDKVPLLGCRPALEGLLLSEEYTTDEQDVIVVTTATLAD